MLRRTQRLGTEYENIQRLIRTLNDVRNSPRHSPDQAKALEEEIRVRQQSLRMEVAADLARVARGQKLSPDSHQAARDFEKQVDGQMWDGHGARTRSIVPPPPKLPSGVDPLEAYKSPPVELGSLYYGLLTAIGVSVLLMVWVGKT